MGGREEMFPMRWTVVLALVLASSAAGTSRGSSEDACPNRPSGKLTVEAEIVKSGLGELVVELVLRSVGDGPVLVYPSVVPEDCNRPEGPHLYLAVSVVSESGTRKEFVGKCPGRLRSPSGFEFLPLLPGDFLGRRIVLSGEPYQVSRLPSGRYQPELSVRTEAKSYLQANHPEDLPCGIEYVFEGVVTAKSVEFNAQ